MKRLNLAIILCLMVFVIGSAVARPQKDAKANPVAGTWDCIAHGSVQGDVPFRLALEQNQDRLTGSISTEDGELAFTSASYNDGALSIVIATSDAKYAVNGKLDGDKLSGQWSKEGDSGKQGGSWEGKRSTTAPAVKQPQ
jgi:hypothetical protein